MASKYHRFAEGDIIFRDTPRRRNVLILEAVRVEKQETLDYDSGEVMFDAVAVYVILDLQTNERYSMLASELDMGTKVV